MEKTRGVVRKKICKSALGRLSHQAGAGGTDHDQAAE